MIFQYSRWDLTRVVNSRGRVSSSIQEKVVLISPSSDDPGTWEHHQQTLLDPFLLNLTAARHSSAFLLLWPRCRTAFICIKLHLPLTWPIYQSCKICLQLYTVLFSDDTSIYFSVISKDMYCASDHLREIVYEQYKQYWSQTLPCGMPLSTSSLDDRLLLTTTRWVRPIKNVFIQ